GYEYGSFHFLEPSFLHNYTDSTLYTATKPGKRTIGTITVDNSEYFRYMGETQILKRDLPEDSRVNIVGNVQDEYIALLDFIKAGTRIKFE
ncbi:DUF871 domain-containing protein, partial [Paenibacillus larvae]